MSWVAEARGLYAIVDPSLSGRFHPIELAEAILSGGCAVLQLRDKRKNDRATLELARELAARARRRGVPFVLNDRADIARLAGADGLHLGQDDLPLEDARLVFDGPIGRSTHDTAQVERAVREGHALLGFGPIFPTRSKENPDPVQGVEGLAAAVARAGVPIVAIGGITLENAPAVVAAGARLCAVIGALASAEDPEAAARELHALVTCAAASS